MSVKNNTIKDLTKKRKILDDAFDKLIENNKNGTLIINSDFVEKYDSLLREIQKLEKQL